MLRATLRGVALPRMQLIKQRLISGIVCSDCSDNLLVRQIKLLLKEAKSLIGGCNEGLEFINVGAVTAALHLDRVQHAFLPVETKLKWRTVGMALFVSHRGG